MNVIIPLLAVALGWLLNELSSLIRLRREDRRAAGPVLTDLLEIRHRLLTLNEAAKEYVKELGKHLQLSSQAQLQFQQYLRTFLRTSFPQSPLFIEQYEEAVSMLGRVDPIRAFRLRSQPLIAPLLDWLQNLAASTETDTQIWSTVFEPELLGRFKPHIEELILDVARAHGWLTWWRARRRLAEPTLSEADRKWISDFIEKLKSAAETTRQKPAG
ncbi:MAG: hypothetical protein WBG29_05580 [Candidatus Acidiferrales bacterium]